MTVSVAANSKTTIDTIWIQYPCSNESLIRRRHRLRAAAPTHKQIDVWYVKKQIIQYLQIIDKSQQSNNININPPKYWFPQQNRQKMSSNSHKKKVNNFLIFLDQQLGSGATGKVYLSCDISNPEKIYATKIIEKKIFQNDQYMKQALRRQCAIQRQLKHPNIVSLVDMCETSNNIYIFQEYCSGTTLKEVLCKRKRLQQCEVLYCMKQICLGYSLLVQKGIIHRDLKPDNILIEGELLKIGDFGFAKQIASQKQFLMSIVGSPIYMSPQILKGEKYNSKCDVWSLGIMIFQLLYGHFPWLNKSTGPQNAVTILNKIFTETLKFPQQPKVSQELKDFIESCLKIQEKQRISWLQIFQHPILESDPVFKEIAKQYRQNVRSALEILNQLANQLKPYQLVGAFLQFKVKALDFKLFRSIMKLYLIPTLKQEEVSIMYELFDKDCNGVIDLQQFLKSFQLCDENIPKLFNEMVENNIFYEDMMNENYFKNIATCYKKYSQEVIDQAYCIIRTIKYKN